MTIYFSAWLLLVSLWSCVYTMNENEYDCNNPNTINAGTPLLFAQPQVANRDAVPQSESAHKKHYGESTQSSEQDDKTRELIDQLFVLMNRDGVPSADPQSEKEKQIKKEYDAIARQLHPEIPDNDED